MIVPAQVMPGFLSRVTGFASSWSEHLAWWDDETPGEFVSVAELAHYLVGRYAAGDTKDFAAAFAWAEQVLEEGEDDAQALISAGLLESLQNVASHESFGPDVFRGWLGPRSTEAWEQIRRLWEDKDTLADVVRSEQQGVVRRPPRDGSTSA